jgi:hypothetical protein
MEEITQSFAVKQSRDFAVSHHLVPSSRVHNVFFFIPMGWLWKKLPTQPFPPNLAIECFEPRASHIADLPMSLNHRFWHPAVLFRGDASY